MSRSLVRESNQFRGRQLEQQSLAAVKIQIHDEEPPGTASASSEQLRRLPEIGLVKVERILAIGTTERIETIARCRATRDQRQRLTI
jgi:hypothetical protein